MTETIHNESACMGQRSHLSARLEGEDDPIAKGIIAPSDYHLCMNRYRRILRLRMEKIDRTRASQSAFFRRVFTAERSAVCLAVLLCCLLGLNSTRTPKCNLTP
jgi:hypothetical protein